MNSCLVHPGWTISNRQAGKLWRARSPLYQRQILQVNIHFSAFFEIYQIHIPSHRCKFKICRFFPFSPKNFANFRDFANFCRIFAIFLRKFHRILSEFREIAPIECPIPRGIGNSEDRGIGNSKSNAGNWELAKLQI